MLKGFGSNVCFFYPYSLIDSYLKGVILSFIMIQFDRFELANGLKVLVHPDTTTPMAVVNILYNVGAKDENPEKTGFAHLFEHLMFGGGVLDAWAESAMAPALAGGVFLLGVGAIRN